jgi:hypothetical protein
MFDRVVADTREHRYGPHNIHRILDRWGIYNKHYSLYYSVLGICNLSHLKLAMKTARTD